MNKSELKKTKNSYFDKYIFVFLAALELLMSFTFFGYIHIPPISITFAYIPILIAACILDTKASAVMGLIFGLASMYKATAYYSMPTDMIFSPFLSGRPLSSIILAVGTRVLFGFVAGLIFSGAKKSKHSKIWLGIAAAILPKLHGIIVYAAMLCLFPDIVHGYLENYFFIPSDIGIMIICVFLVEISTFFYGKTAVKKFKKSIDCSYEIPYAEAGKKQNIILGFALFVVIMTVAATLYFAERSSFLLQSYGLYVTSDISHDLTHLQIQFMLAVLSLDIISIVVLELGYKYTAYQKFLGEIDVITNVMGRRIFLNCCKRTQQKFEKSASERGWFLFLDVDRFKDINDTLGHTVGDNVLKEIAASLKLCLGDYGIIGRIGGDEFAAMLDRPISKEELQKRLNIFLEEISDILPSSNKVSCSIGACSFQYPADMSELMSKADANLYSAKSRGRACFVLGD